MLCIRTTVILLVISHWGCAVSTPIRTGPDASLPEVPREFRAAWVASVANINWPSKPGLTVEAQKEEAIGLLDLLHTLHYNAVILQVRPQCDALYPSDLEPWSYFLTGRQGQAPEPFYDPLQFWIESAHQRGLELHAWLNPYRAHHTSSGQLTDASIVRTKPELARRLENGFWWLDPSLPGTQNHSFAVVMDLIKRYDIDGLHFDDYFYPYPSYNDHEDFPDSSNWRNYLAHGGKQTKSDWRRAAVNRFIKRVYKAIKKEKKHVKFGISPFGIWRPNHPPSIQGFDQHEQLYADAKLWINKGWIDYMTPQLYWPINQIPQSYPVLLNWWLKENKKNRLLWPGLSIGRIKGVPGADEVMNQIMVSRAMLEPTRAGTVHWSIAPLLDNDTLGQVLLHGPYQQRALVPSQPHLSKKKSDPPILSQKITTTTVQLSWRTATPNISNWVIFTCYGGTWQWNILPRDRRSIQFPRIKTFVPKQGETKPPDRKLINVVLYSIDRFGQPSVAVRLVP